MQEEIKYTREQFMDMIKEGMLLINKDTGSKKAFRASDYTALGKIQIALEKYDFVQMLNKTYEGI